MRTDFEMLIKVDTVLFIKYLLYVSVFSFKQTDKLFERKHIPQ